MEIMTIHSKSYNSNINSLSEGEIPISTYIIYIIGICDGNQ